MKEPINLTTRDLEYITNNKTKIGEGTDGSVYYIGRDICYKFYHHSEERLSAIDKPILDSNGVNIRDYKTLNYTNTYDITKYYDKEGVKLTREMALLKAIERQKDIKYSNLPTNIIYVDGRVMGCELKYSKSIGSIYSACYLPLFIRRKICKSILLKLKELTDSYIYPVDVCQKYKVNMASKKDSNVLLSYNLNPILIDLDGKSTAYLEFYSKKYESISLNSIGFLIMELITNIDFQQDYDVEDLDYINELLRDAKLSYELIDKFYSSHLSYDELNEVIETYNKKLVK